MSKRCPIDYLVIGHVSRDVVSLEPPVFAAGGTAAFAARTAQALGLRTAVVTSAAADFDMAAALPGCAVACRPAAATTTFANQYTPAGRRQMVHALAAPLRAADVPPGWRCAPVVHLGPITDRLDPDIIDCFDGALIGLTPQGWMRAWDADGRVYATPMRHAERLLPRASAVVISREDYRDDAELDAMRRLSRLLVVTAGYNGCVIYEGETVHTVPAPQVQEVNPTGAGDIFAAAFFVQLQRTGDVTASAVFANRVASETVAQPDLPSKMAAVQMLIK